MQDSFFFRVCQDASGMEAPRSQWDIELINSTFRHMKKKFSSEHVYLTETVKEKKKINVLDRVKKKSFHKKIN